MKSIKPYSKLISLFFLHISSLGAVGLEQGQSNSFWANPPKWSNSDTIRESVWQAEHLIDYFQTIEVIKDPSRHELNPILGKYPSQGEVNAYFVTTGLIHYGISNWLPVEYRSGWQWITIVATGRTITRNYQLGVRFSF